MSGNVAGMEASAVGGTQCHRRASATPWGGAPCAVREVGYFGPVSPDGRGGCVPIRRTAQILAQSKHSDKAVFHTENAGLLSTSAVFALRTYASLVVGGCRVVTYFTNGRCARAVPALCRNTPSSTQTPGTTWVLVVRWPGTGSPASCVPRMFRVFTAAVVAAPFCPAPLFAQGMGVSPLPHPSDCLQPHPGRYPTPPDPQHPSQYSDPHLCHTPSHPPHQPYPLLYPSCFVCPRVVSQGFLSPPVL